MKFFLSLLFCLFLKSIDAFQVEKKGDSLQITARIYTIVQVMPKAGSQESARSLFMTTATTAFILPEEWLKSKEGFEVVELGYSYEAGKTVGSFGSGPAQFRDPVQLGVDLFDNLYVVDRAQDRIQKFTASGTFLKQFGSFNWDTAISFKKDFSSVEEGSFDRPFALAFNERLGMYISDLGNDRVVELDLDGNFKREIRPRDGFDEPSFIATSSRNDLYVLDSQKDRILVFNSMLSQIMSLGGFGQGQNYFKRPKGFVLSKTDEALIVWDSGNSALKRYSSQGRFEASTSVAKDSQSLVQDGFGLVYVSGKSGPPACYTPHLQSFPCPLKNGFQSGVALKNRHFFVLEQVQRIQEWVPRLRVQKIIVP